MNVDSAAADLLAAYRFQRNAREAINIILDAPELTPIAALLEKRVDGLRYAEAQIAHKSRALLDALAGLSAVDRVAAIKRHGVSVSLRSSGAATSDISGESVAESGGAGEGSPSSPAQGLSD